MMSSVKKSVKGEMDFPRGGKNKKSKKTPSKQTDNLFKTDEVDDIPHSPAKKTKVKKKLESNSSTPLPKKNEKVSSAKKVTKPEQNLEKLKFNDVEKGMHILGCVSKVGDYNMTFDLPGGLQGEVTITAISDCYTDQLKKLTNEEDEDEASVAQLQELFQPGCVLPCRVAAIKVRTGSRKKIFLSINPKYVNSDLTEQHLAQGLVLSGSVKACEDHGFVIDLGIDGITAFLSNKHAEKFLKNNNISQLHVGQVLMCAVFSVTSRVVSVGISQQHIEKAQISDLKKLPRGVPAGMRVRGVVKELLDDGVLVNVSGQTCAIHQSHIHQGVDNKTLRPGDQVRGTVLYTLPGKQTPHLSLLPHLCEPVCRDVYARLAPLVHTHTTREACVAEVMDRAVFFTLEGETTRALATMANLTAVSKPGEPLQKTFKIGDTHRCVVIGFSLLDCMLLVRLVSPTSGEETTVLLKAGQKRRMKEEEDIKSDSDTAECDSPKKKNKKKDVKESDKTPSKHKKAEDSDNEAKNSSQKKKKGKQTVDEIESRKSESKRKDMDTLSSEVLKQTPKSESKKKKKEKLGDGQPISDDQTQSLTNSSSMKKKKDKIEDVPNISNVETHSIESETTPPSNEKKKKERVREKGGKTEEGGDSGVASDDDADMEVVPAGPNAPRLSLSGGFSWSEEFVPPPKRVVSPDSSSDEETEEKSGVSGKSRLQQRTDRQDEEKRIYDIERGQLTGDQTPVSSADFDRLVLTSPDSSVVWLRYMAFHLETVEVDKARGVAERALKTISFREEQERLNVWTALLNLENMYGGDTQVMNVFDRAVQTNDPIKVYRQLVQIYIHSNKMEEAEKLYMTMTRKFSQDKSVWTGLAIFFFKNQRLDAARKVLQRCLKSLEKREHVEMISKFAQLEYKFGECERGATMFENILSNYPKRTDLWSVYLDMIIKAGTTQDARSVFERVIHMKMSSKKMQFFFKKYLEFEKKFGDGKSQEKVKQKAVEYVQSLS